METHSPLLCSCGHGCGDIEAQRGPAVHLGVRRQRVLHCRGPPGGHAQAGDDHQPLPEGGGAGVPGARHAEVAGAEVQPVHQLPHLHLGEQGRWWAGENRDYIITSIDYVIVLYSAYSHTHTHTHILTHTHIHAHTRTFTPTHTHTHTHTHSHTYALTHTHTDGECGRTD